MVYAKEYTGVLAGLAECLKARKVEEKVTDIHEGERESSTTVVRRFTDSKNDSSWMIDQ